MQKRWQRGDTVMVRYSNEDRMWRCYREYNPGIPFNLSGWPNIVLSDEPDLVALYVPEAAPAIRWNIDTSEPLTVRPGHGESVRLLFPGKRYQVTCFYETGSGPAPWIDYLFPGAKADRFYGWKVDLCSPFARTEAGFDMIDDVLDIMISPDMTFRWKDEDQMDRFIDLGIYTKGEAEELRDVGRVVIEMALRREPPFDDEWRHWRPSQDLRLGDYASNWPYLSVPEPYKGFTGD